MNNISIVGRLVRDPDLKTTQSGLSVLNFTVAVNRSFKNDQGNYETDFIDCVAWRQQAEFINEWFTKGKVIAVCGSLQIRKYQDRQGNNRRAAEIQVREVMFVQGTNQESQTQSWQEQVGAVPAAQVVATNEDFLEPPADDDTKLPFDF